MRWVMTKVRVNVTYHSGVGYVSVANHKVTRSLAALSLEGLRTKILVATALRRRAGEEVRQPGLRSSGGLLLLGCDRFVSLLRHPSVRFRFSSSLRGRRRNETTD